MSRKRFSIIATAYDRKGNIISIGNNNYLKSNTWQKQLSVSCGMSEERVYTHAEVSALIKARNLRKKVYLLKIERYDVEGKPKLAFPCCSCQLAIKLSGVRKVVFTTEDGFNEWIV